MKIQSDQPKTTNSLSYISVHFHQIRSHYLYHSLSNAVSSQSIFKYPLEPSRRQISVIIESKLNVSVRNIFPNITENDGVNGEEQGMRSASEQRRYFREAVDEIGGTRQRTHLVQRIVSFRQTVQLAHFIQCQICRRFQAHGVSYS